LDNKYDHPDFHIPRIKKDEEIVQSIVELLTSSWVNPFQLKKQELVNIASGVMAPNDIKKDQLYALSTGTDRYDSFKGRLLDPSCPKFPDPLKNNSLKTFKKNIAKKSVGKVKNE
jgi:hypothetical protein